MYIILNNSKKNFDGSHIYKIIDQINVVEH